MKKQKALDRRPLQIPEFKAKIADAWSLVPAQELEAACTVVAQTIFRESATPVKARLRRPWIKLA